MFALAWVRPTTAFRSLGTVSSFGSLRGTLGGCLPKHGIASSNQRYLFNMTGWRCVCGDFGLCASVQKCLLSRAFVGDNSTWADGQAEQNFS
jgi:hypothetical protein